jgi:hypothetical protein
LKYFPVFRVFSRVVNTTMKLYLPLALVTTTVDGGLVGFLSALQFRWRSVASGEDDSFKTWTSCGG